MLGGAIASRAKRQQASGTMHEEQDDPVFQQALEWLVRLDDDAATPTEREAFQKWLGTPAHAAAFDRAQHLWGRFDIVRPELQRIRGDGVTRRRAMLGAAALLIAAPTLYTLTRPGLFADYRVGPGERQQALLADGSRVELGSQTTLSEVFSASERRVVLHSGQAFFEVAPDARRPFVVEAGPDSVTALGTAFDVRYVDDRLTVAVTEHAVAVRNAGQAIVVEQGWAVSVDHGRIEPLTPVSQESVQAWREDRLIFEDMPLRYVLTELARYRGGNIMLTDDRLGDLSVTAIFDARNPANALRRIEETLPIRVFDAGGLVTLIHPA